MNNRQRRDKGPAYVTDEDKPFLYKDRRFDDEAWQEIEARQKN